MKTKLLLFVFFLSLQSSIYACGGTNTPVFAGEISYKISPTNPLTCTVLVVFDFDIAETLATDSIWVDWGDNTIATSVFANSITADSAANTLQGYTRYYKHVYAGTHTFSSVPDSGFYFITVLTQFRANDISNISVGGIPFQAYHIETQVRIDTVAGFVNDAPLMKSPTVEYASVDNVFHQNDFLYDPDKDSVVFDLVTPQGDHTHEISDYFLPDSFCQELGVSSIFQIDHTTGEIWWTQPCSQGVFDFAVVARKYRNGQLLGTVMRDQNIYVSGPTFNSIASYLPKRSVRFYPNPANSFIQLQTDEPVSICIANVLGETVRRQNIQSSSTIDISDLSSGVYFIRDEKTCAVMRFVKE